MDFASVFTTIFTHPLVKLILALIVGNFILGVIVDIKVGVFHWDQQADFLKTMVLPLVGGCGVLQMVLWAGATDYLPVGWAEISGTAAWGIVVVALLARLGRLLKTLVPGLPIPGDPAISTDTSTTARLIKPEAT